MTAQDDAREREMVGLFNLTVPPDRRRADIDGTLRIDGRTVPFELKSTTGRSISTVRDFGPEHIRKWRDLHWLFGFYTPDGNRLLHCHYASPDGMSAWIGDKERYVRPDVVLADHVPELVTETMVVEILGDKPVYTPADARLVQKNQYSADRYRELQDVPGGYSRRAMLGILRDRCRYVIQRGSTLNNPHIAGSYFDGWERITEDHAARLREMVRAYFAG